MNLIHQTKNRANCCSIEVSFWFSGEQAFRSKLNQKRHLSVSRFKHSTEIMLSHLAGKTLFLTKVYLIISSQRLLWESFIFSATHQLVNHSTTMIFMGAVQGI